MIILTKGIKNKINSFIFFFMIKKIIIIKNIGIKNKAAPLINIEKEKNIELKNKKRFFSWTIPKYKKQKDKIIILV